MQRGESRYFRVSADFARLVAEMDGVKNHVQLANSLGSPWTSGQVDGVIAKLATSGMLDDGTNFSRKRASRLRFAPPLTVQLSLLNPGRSLAVLKPVVAKAVSKPGIIVLSAVAGLGLVGLMLQAVPLREALVNPQTIITYLYLFVGILLTTAVHEVAHGAVLTYYGGRPSRLGVMLFYLSPAFFCDVSDGWRLPDKGDRVRVALAGIATQLTVAAFAGAAALALTGPARPGLLLFSVATYLAAAFNLVPFIKLDGYIALMTHLDVPHLRDKAMLDGRRALARVLFGGTYRSELPGRAWVPWYGLACMTFPIYVICAAMAIWIDAVVRMGPVGAVVICLVAVMVVRYVLRGAIRLVREALRAGASLWRTALAGVGVLAVIAAVLCVVRLPVTMNGGYLMDSAGHVEFVSANEIDTSRIAADGTVTLYRAGLVAREVVGAGVLDGTPGRRTSVPIGALLPVAGVPVELPAWSYALRLTRTPSSSTGAATVSGADQPLWQWLTTKYVAPALNW